MTAIQEIIKHGPETYLVAGPVAGGQLVVPSAEKVDVAGDAAVNVLGVAVQDADLESNQNTSGFTVTAALDREEVAVAFRGVYNLTASGAVAFGEHVVAAASGQVRAYNPGGTDTADMIVGKCVETAGIADTETGRIRLNLG